MTPLVEDGFLCPFQITGEKTQGLLSPQSYWKTDLGEANEPLGIYHPSGISHSTTSHKYPTHSSDKRSREDGGGESWWAGLSSRSLTVYKQLLGASRA